MIKEWTDIRVEIPEFGQKWNNSRDFFLKKKSNNGEYLLSAAILCLRSSSNLQREINLKWKENASLEHLSKRSKIDIWMEKHEILKDLVLSVARQLPRCWFIRTLVVRLQPLKRFYTQGSKDLFMKIQSTAMMAHTGAD